MKIANTIWSESPHPTSRQSTRRRLVEKAHAVAASSSRPTSDRARSAREVSRDRPIPPSCDSGPWVRAVASWVVADAPWAKKPAQRRTRALDQSTTTPREGRLMGTSPMKGWS